MWPDFANTREISDVLHVLSAMITPAVLILASSSLLITTSSRSIRCIDRVRERISQLEALGSSTDEATELHRQHIYQQLEINTRPEALASPREEPRNLQRKHISQQRETTPRRAPLLQRGMSRLYLGIS